MTDWLRLTYRWPAWQRIRWGCAFLLVGLAIGAVAVAVVNAFIPVPPIR